MDGSVHRGDDSSMQKCNGSFMVGRSPKQKVKMFKQTVTYSCGLATRTRGCTPKAIPTQSSIVNLSFLLGAVSGDTKQRRLRILLRFFWAAFVCVQSLFTA